MGSKKTRPQMGLTLFLIAIGVALLAAGVVSLILGKTIGLYGVIETRGSVFYWIIVSTYFGLGGLSTATGGRMLLKALALLP
jgi:hypothetical protein